MTSLIGLLVLAASPVPDTGSQIRMRVLFRETANLTYQLDAVSGRLGHIDPSDFQALWKKEFLKTDADRAFVKEWGDVVSRYQSSVPVNGIDLPLERLNGYISLSDKLRVAELRATSTDAFLNEVTLLVLPSDVVRLGDVLHHFEPAFHGWWQREAATKGRAFADRMGKLLTEPAIRD